MEKNRSSYKNIILLLITAFIWGTAFVAQSVGLDFLKPLSFGFFKFMLGGLVLIPFVLFLRRRPGYLMPDKKTLFTGAFLCGICLFAGSSLQQIALQTTTVGKAGFITTLYIVLVPLFGILLRKKTTYFLWIAVGLALIGLYLLSIKSGFRIEQSDILLLLCAVCFTIHILVIDKYTSLIDGVTLSCMQFFIAAALSFVFMLTFEGVPQASSVLGAWFPLVYSGAFSCGIAFTFQILGQKDFNPTAASILMSLESVFSVLGGLVILGQELTQRETLGCILMFAAIIFAQLPAGKKISAENTADT